MARREFTEGAEEHAKETAREVEEGHTEMPAEPAKRDQRLVVRVNADEMRRLKQFAEKENMPVSVAVRHILFTQIRRWR